MKTVALALPAALAVPERHSRPTIRGPWGAWWILWWAALIVWAIGGQQFVDFRTWVFVTVLIWAAWLPTELLGAWRLKVRKDSDPREIVKTASQLAQIVGALAHDHVGWRRWLGWGSAMVLMVGVASGTIAIALWQVHPALGVLAAITMPCFLWPHFYLRWIYG